MMDASRQTAAGGQYLQVVEEAARAAERAERLWQEMRATQLAAAESMHRSAISQDRAAKSYEDLAEHAFHAELRDEYLKRAGRHRAFAEEDRRMAARMR